MRLIDSHVSGSVFYDPEHTLLEIVRTEIVGNVTAGNDAVRVVITDSSIKGRVGCRRTVRSRLGYHQYDVEGNVNASSRVALSLSMASRSR